MGSPWPGQCGCESVVVGLEQQWACVCLAWCLVAPDQLLICSSLAWLQVCGQQLVAPRRDAGMVLPWEECKNRKIPENPSILTSIAGRCRLASISSPGAHTVRFLLPVQGDTEHGYAIVLAPSRVCYTLLAICFCY